MATRERLYSDLAIPPGETLAEEIGARGMSQRELAERAGRPEQAISEIIHGKKAITAETALQLEKVLGVPASFWIDLEAGYQTTLARNREAEEMNKQAVRLDAFPIKEMQKRDLLPPTKDKGELLLALLSFFGVASVDALQARQEGVLGYRVTPGSKVSPGALFVWMREGELVAAEIKTQPYSDSQFRDALREARALTTEKNWAVAHSRMVEACANAGVAFVIRRGYPKSGASGVARWLSPDKALIQLSTKRSYVDMFWFSFFHEAKHVLDRQKGRVFVNDINDDPVAENLADRFASEALIPEVEYQAFMKSRPRAKADVTRFAASVGIHPGIVVGRLQYDKVVPQSHMNDLRLRFISADQ